jgi:Protein of unknown function (DUF3223)
MRKENNWDVGILCTLRHAAFQSKATEFFKAMLERYRVSEKVNDDDALHLAALLERHDEYKEKIRIGVVSFSVMMTEHGTPCFRINRKDGTGTDFSYRRCITQRFPSRKQEVSQAFRRVVRFDLYRARDEFFSKNKDADGRETCAETGERVSQDPAHMDHRAPLTFGVLVTTFLEGKGLSVEDVPITSGRDEQVSPEITDSDLCEAFRRYHANLAKLDLVKSTANLAQSARNRVKPCRIRLPSD